jgi:hypothetical protein
MADIITLSPDNYSDLATFLGGFENETKSKDTWRQLFRYWWEKNPAFSQDFERGWILSDNGKIAGFIGNIPSYFQLMGKKTTVFTISTWHVLPEYRGQSIELLFRIMDANPDALLFDTTPTEIVANILTSFDFLPLPGYQNRNSLIVVNHDKFLKTKFRDEWVGKISAKALAPISRVIQIPGLVASRKKSGYEIKELSQTDSAFDELWERTKDLYANTNIRTAEIIQWLCFDNPHCKKTVLGCYCDGTLSGFLIAGPVASDKLKILKCHDLWFDPAQEHVLESLIGHTMQFAKKHSFDLVLFPHFTNALGKKYGRLGMLRGKTTEVRELVRLNPDQAAAVQADNSYFVELQGDRGMF